MSAKNTEATFWARVNRGAPYDCWEWEGAITSSGYGNTSWHGARVQAHRLAYFLAVGGIELKTGFRDAGVAKEYQKFVLHRCDNRRCCNPAHLFLGSMRDNQIDAYSKGRREQPKSMHVNAKIPAAEVSRIRSRYKEGGITQKALASEYSVSQVSISLILRRKTYKDVE